MAGLEAWMREGSYSWLLDSSGVVRLDFGSATEALADALAYDIGRFSCAAYESLIGAVPVQGMSLGWSLVRHYYAMFYAAHALLRISGISITMLTPQTSGLLNKVGGQYLGISPQLTSGLHLIQLDQSNRRELTIKKIGGANGGSHEEMWSQFLALVVDIENQLVLRHGQSSEVQMAVSILSALRQHLCKQGKSNGAWPSTVRNNLNYKHQYGVWYPYTVTEKFVDKLSGRMSRWVPGHVDAYEIGLSTDDLPCLADACNVMAHLLTATLRDVSARAPAPRKSFVDRMPFRLLRIEKFSI